MVPTNPLLVSIQKWVPSYPPPIQSPLSPLPFSKYGFHLPKDCSHCDHKNYLFEYEEM